MDDTGVKLSETAWRIVVKRERRERWISLVLITSLLLCSRSSVCATSKKMSVKLSKKTCSIAVGSKYKLKAVIQGKRKGAKVIFKSLNQKIASVSKKGVVTGKKAGKAKIKASIQGKKISAVCVVTVKKNSVKENKPEVSKEPVATMAPGNTEIPDETKMPQSTEKPQNTAEPDATAEPSASEAPKQTPAPSPAISSDTLLVLAKYDKDRDMTVFLLNRDYEGTVHISFQGETFTMSGKVKEALLILQNSYVMKTNHAGTIRVGRVYPEINWSLEDLKTDTVYSMSVEAKNTYDTSYKNCGAIYFQGDVTSVIGVY